MISLKGSILFIPISNVLCKNVLLGLDIFGISHGPLTHEEAGR